MCITLNLQIYTMAYVDSDTLMRCKDALASLKKMSSKVQFAQQRHIRKLKIRDEKPLKTQKQYGS